MHNRLPLLVPFALIVFLSGCTQQTGNEVQFKNDAITIENFIVDNIAPYSNTFTSIEFDVQNNVDVTVNNVRVKFFDIPGFSRDKALDCGSTEEKDPNDSNGCIYTIESLDSRHVTMKLKADEVKSPTPYTVSVSVTYTHRGFREAIIPIIDSVIKKEPIFKFSQSTPNFGPVVFDIEPLLEREKIVDGRIIKEYWGIAENEFVVRFVMKKTSTISESFQINIDKLVDTRSEAGYVWALEFTTVNLVPQPCEKNFHTTDNKRWLSEKPVNETYNILICSFKPTSTSRQSEFTSIVKITYNYDFGFARRQNFVIQPPI